MPASVFYIQSSLDFVCTTKNDGIMNVYIALYIASEV